MPRTSQPQTQSIQESVSQAKDTDLTLVDAARQGLLHIEVMPNNKVIAVVHAFGEKGDSILIQLEQLLGNTEGVHVNDKEGSFAALFPPSDNLTYFSTIIAEFRSVVLAALMTRDIAMGRVLYRTLRDSGLVQDEDKQGKHKGEDDGKQTNAAAVCRQLEDSHTTVAERPAVTRAVDLPGMTLVKGIHRSSLTGWQCITIAYPDGLRLEVPYDESDVIAPVYIEAMILSLDIDNTDTREAVRQGCLNFFKGDVPQNGVDDYAETGTDILWLEAFARGFQKGYEEALELRSRNVSGLSEEGA